MGVLNYYFRTADFEYLRCVQSQTVVVFVHGILSHSKKAFSLHQKEGYFWDLLIDNPLLSSFDFALFSYGRIDISYILEGEYPVNNLIRIAHELHGYVSQYKNVLFIAHSQGGLLAKTYASLFFKTQGIHLLTLHTPHRNKSFSVMRFNDEDIWDKEACFQVPHIFCASLNDNKIVKPDNAFHSCHDRKFLSKDTSKSNLGHSHLSSSPDIELLRAYIEDIMYFKFSGISRVFCDTSITAYGSISEGSTIELYYSRFSSNLCKSVNATEFTQVIDYPWSNLIAKGKEISKCISIDSSKIAIVSKSCSVDFFTKYLFEHFLSDAKIKINGLDCGGDSLIASNDIVCDWLLQNKFQESNPYAHLPFDAHDFRKGSLVESDEFLKYFLDALFKKRFSLKNTYENGTYKPLLKEYFLLVVKDFRKQITQEIYNEAISKKSIGINRFESTIKKFVQVIKKLPEKKNTYSIVYSELKKLMHNVGQEIDIKGADVIISKLFRSDGDVYWLDNYLGQIYHEQTLNSTLSYT